MGPEDRRRKSSAYRHVRARYPLICPGLDGYTYDHASRHVAELVASGRSLTRRMLRDAVTKIQIEKYRSALERRFGEDIAGQSILELLQRVTRCRRS